MVVSAVDKGISARSRGAAPECSPLGYPWARRPPKEMKIVRDFRPSGGERPTLTATTNPISAETAASSEMPVSFPSQQPSLSWTVSPPAIYLAVARSSSSRFFIGLAFSRRLIRRREQLTTRVTGHGPTAPSHPSRPRARRIRIHFRPRHHGRSPINHSSARPTGGAGTPPNSTPSSPTNSPTSPAATPLTQRLSLLHRAIFWFSPLAWCLDRRLADLAEQASDEAALSWRHRPQTLRPHLAGFLRSPARCSRTRLVARRLHGQGRSGRTKS